MPDPSCITDQWSPGIGDPSVFGWLTVLAYLLAAAACLQTALRLIGRERWFWGLLTASLAALAVNKQLDLQSALTAAGRCAALDGGWYAERRRVQLGFVLGLALAALTATGAALIAARRASRPVRLAVVGAGLLLGFVAIRAAGFHHLDALTRSSVLGMPLNLLLELPGIVLIGASAAFRTARARPASGGAR